MGIALKLLFIMLFAQMLNLDLAAAGPRTRPAEPPNCLIHITSTRKSLATDTRTHPLHLKSKAACERAAARHRPNFAPGVVRKKVVKHEWRGK